MNQTSRLQIAALLILVGGALVCLSPGGPLWYGRTVRVTSSKQGPTAYSRHPGIGAGPKIGAALLALGGALGILGGLNQGLRKEVQ